MKSFCSLLFVALLFGTTPGLILAGSDQDDSGRKKNDPNQEQTDDLIGRRSVDRMRFVEGGNRLGVDGKSSGGTGKKGDKAFTDSNGKRTVSFERKGNGIVVRVTRKYSPEDHGSLISKHPDLADYIEMFPKQIDNSRIAMTFSVTTEYEAASLEELKEKHPEAYNLHRRYSAKMQRAKKKKRSR